MAGRQQSNARSEMAVSWIGAVLWAVAFTGVISQPVSNLSADIISQNRLKIDLTDPEDTAEKAEWSDPEHIGITEQGLGWTGGGGMSRTAWFRTRPMGVGLSWRPLTRTGIRVHITPEARPISDTRTEHLGDVYVRYSPDLKNWSDWQVLAVEPEMAGEPVPEGGARRAVAMRRLFTGQLGIARESQTEYHKLLEEFAEQDVPWKSDEEAAAKWIVKRDPKFFERHHPYIGHVQFLYETDLHNGRRLTSFEVNMVWVVSGLHQAPQDRSSYQGRGDIPWRFDANQVLNDKTSE